MRCLNRNKNEFFACLYKDKKETVDEYGNLTGEFTIEYAYPIPMYANISPAQGDSQVEQFGNSLQYDKVIVTDDIFCAIDENSVLFVDIEPKFDEDGNPLFDYIVKKVARSLNSVSIAISKVVVS